MLKKIRLRRKLSQAELATRIGITQGYLSKLENITTRRKIINTQLVEKLSIELKVPPVILLIYFYSPSCPKCHFKCRKCILKTFKM